MKSILEFDLPEEQEEFKMAVNGGKYISSIQNLDNYLRNMVKHDSDKLSPDRLDAYIEIRDRLHEFCQEFTIWS